MAFSKIRRSIFIRVKRLVQFAMTRPNKQQVLFIVGCQRSGTTLLSRIFERDWLAKTYGEVSSISSDDARHGIRLNSLSDVANSIKSQNAPFAVLKPLVESQRTPELLKFFAGSKAVWIYRDYKDVAASNIARFGELNAINDLRPIANVQSPNWRSEFVPSDVEQLVREHFSEDMSPHDAAVLFWYVRNRLFFDLELDNDPDVMLCRYESLVESPKSVMVAIYDFCGQAYPSSGITSRTHANSVRKGSGIGLSQGVEKIANSLLQRLDLVWNESQVSRKHSAKP